MLHNFSCWQARTARKRFESPEGDHLTLVNVYRASDQFLDNRSGLSTENHEENFRKWCKKYFIDSCSMRRAREIHRLPINIPCVIHIFLLISNKNCCCRISSFKFDECFFAAKFAKVLNEWAFLLHRAGTTCFSFEDVLLLLSSSK